MAKKKRIINKMSGEYDICWVIRQLKTFTNGKWDRKKNSPQHMLQFHTKRFSKDELESIGNILEKYNSFFVNVSQYTLNQQIKEQNLPPQLRGIKKIYDQFGGKVQQFRERNQQNNVNLSFWQNLLFYFSTLSLKNENFVGQISKSSTNQVSLEVKSINQELQKKLSQYEQKFSQFQRQAAISKEFKSALFNTIKKMIEENSISLRQKNYLNISSQELTNEDILQSIQKFNLLMSEKNSQFVKVTDENKYLNNLLEQNRKKHQKQIQLISSSNQKSSYKQISKGQENDEEFQNLQNSEVQNKNIYQISLYEDKLTSLKWETQYIKKELNDLTSKKKLMEQEFHNLEKRQSKVIQKEKQLQKKIQKIQEKQSMEEVIKKLNQQKKIALANVEALKKQIQQLNQQKKIALSNVEALKKQIKQSENAVKKNKKEIQDSNSAHTSLKQKIQKSKLQFGQYSTKKQKSQTELRKIEDEKSKKRRDLDNLNNEMKKQEQIFLKRLKDIQQACTEKKALTEKAEQQVKRRQDKLKEDLNNLQINFKQQEEREVNLNKKRDRILDQFQKLQDIQTSSVYFGDIMNGPSKQKTFLVKQIQKLNEERKIKRTELLYSFPKMKECQFHPLVDCHSDYIVMVQLENGMKIAGYSKTPLQKKKENKGPGFLASLTNREAFFKKNKEAKLTVYNDFYLKFGNSELLIKLPESKFGPPKQEELKVSSNFGESNTNDFFCRNFKDKTVMFGSNTRQEKLRQYEIFCIEFQQ